MNRDMRGPPPRMTVLCVRSGCSINLFLFFFNDTATTEIYTLSLHDALPIYYRSARCFEARPMCRTFPTPIDSRSEEHTSELQSHSDLVCRLLLEKKKKI